MYVGLHVYNFISIQTHTISQMNLIVAVHLCDLLASKVGFKQLLN